MKCLPSNKLPQCHGTVLHDWHAEILALRAFNRYLLDQALHTLTNCHNSSPFIRPRPTSERTKDLFQPFIIKEDVKIYMYCSEAPCGDASMELVMDRQEDATPWTTPEAVVLSNDRNGTEAGEPEGMAALRGRSHFGKLGAVRCKPSRPDAPLTLSKSCTDKLTRTQTTSILSSLTSLLICPQNAYIHTLVLPHSQLNVSAISRAFSRSGRLQNLSPETAGSWVGGYAWNGFQVQGTQREFAWSRRMVGSGEKAVPCNMSAVWTPMWQETLIGGVLQGRRQFDIRGASSICRVSLWGAAVKLAGLVGVPILVETVGKKRYKDVKEAQLLAARRRVKEDVRREGLPGWVKNTGDDEFTHQSS
jgi:tRNA-specific adenosine deaminase 1